MSEIRVEAHGLRYEKNGRVLLEDVEMHALAGELIGVVGPNGAGKTTLLRALAGDVIPSAGEVALMGQPSLGRSSRELAALRAVLSSNTPADIPFAVRTVIESGRFRFGGVPGEGSDAADAAVEEAMRVTGVEPLGDRRFDSLSGGEQARVMLARVLAQESPILLLDEPTSSLDLTQADAVLGLLASFMATATVVCAIHDLNVAAAHCDRLLLMSRGRLVASGSPREVLDARLLAEVYAHPIRVIPHPFRDAPLVLVDG